MTKAKQARKRREMEPADWQEAHSPTEAVMVVIDQGGGQRARRTVERGRRRKQDARMWDALTPDLEWAADRIARAFVLVTAGLTVKAMDYSVDRVSGGSGGGETLREISLTRDYWTWCSEAPAAGVNVSRVIQILGHGRTPHDIDRDRRQRNGTAKDNLIRGLEEYLRMKGRLKR